MPLTRLIQGSVTLQKTGQATSVGVFPFSTGYCMLKASAWSFALTHIPVGETAVVNGLVQPLIRVEGACATLSED